MKTKTILYSALAILISLAFGVASKSCSDDEKQILDAYFNQYKDVNNINHHKTYILKRSKFVLDENFLKRLEDKENRYQKSQKACDELVKEGKDTTGLNACKMSKMYSKFRDVLTQEDKMYFEKYQSYTEYKDYSKLIQSNNLQLLDSLEFLNTDAKNLEKKKFLEFRGPFFAKDRSKALLEVYTRAQSLDDGTAYFLIFINKDNHWQLIGNVNY